MPTKRSAMQEIKEVLGLKFEARLSHERIAAASNHIAYSLMIAFD